MAGKPSINPRDRGAAALKARDRGMALISRLNRWMIAGAVGLAGLISLGASGSFHGHTPSSSKASQSSSSSPAAQSSSSSGGSIQQPAQAPASTPAPVAPSGPVVSGGS